MSDSGQLDRTIWLKPGDPSIVQIIDQRALPHRVVIKDLRSYRDGVAAIRDMLVRGAPLIGATAAWSLYLAALESQASGETEKVIAEAAAELSGTRPTAVNLRWAIDRVLVQIHKCDDSNAVLGVIRDEAESICEEDIEICRGIGDHGLGPIRAAAARKRGEPVNILTHCNAGWLATIQWGTATAPMYIAKEQGIPIHVWIDETRPRNQGSQLTAWELAARDIPHTVIVDSAGGHLMQRGQVDICITGTDRTARNGDVANKIGTYLQALAARDNDIPFYVAVPGPSIDWSMRDGLKETPIEERSPDEVSRITGLSNDELQTVQVVAKETPVKNFGFDVTPARLITGLITERGICDASEDGLTGLYPDQSGDD